MSVKYKIKIGNDDSHLSIPLELTHSNLGQAELVEEEFVKNETEKAINSIMDYETVRLIPVNNKRKISRIDYNINILNDNKFPNQTTLGSVGFDNDDIKYRRNNFKRSFLNLMFFDSDIPNSQNLIGQHTIFSKINRFDLNGYNEGQTNLPIRLIEDEFGCVGRESNSESKEQPHDRGVDYEREEGRSNQNTEGGRGESNVEEREGGGDGNRSNKDFEGSGHRETQRTRGSSSTDGIRTTSTTRVGSTVTERELARIEPDNLNSISSDGGTSFNYNSISLGFGDSKLESCDNAPTTFYITTKELSVNTLIFKDQRGNIKANVGWYSHNNIVGYWDGNKLNDVDTCNLFNTTSEKTLNITNINTTTVVKDVNQVPLRFIVEDPLIKPIGFAEGFYLYQQPKLLPTSIYMRANYNNAKTGVSTDLVTTNIPQTVDKVVNKLHTKYDLKMLCDTYYYELDTTYSNNISIDGDKITVNLFEIQVV